GKANPGRDFSASIGGFDQLAYAVNPQILVVDGRAAGCTGQYRNSMAVTLINAYALVTGTKREQRMLHARSVGFERDIEDIGYEEIALPVTVRHEACGGLAVHALVPVLVRHDEHGLAAQNPSPGRAAWTPDDFRASIHSSISSRSQATFLLVSAMRLGNSPRCSMLKMVRSLSGIIEWSFFRLINTFCFGSMQHLQVNAKR